MTERHCAASRRFSGKRIQPRWTPCLSVLYLRCMSSVEEYRKRAQEARQQANTCDGGLERQGLLIIADQCERIASYKDLTSLVTSPSTKATRLPAGRRRPDLISTDKPR